MKILILANNDVGLYKFRKELIEKFIELNHQVVISLPYGDFVPKLKEIGCEFFDTPIDCRGMNPFNDYILLKQYKRLLKRIYPDIVITYTIKPNIYGGLVSRYAKIPYFVNITGLGTAFERNDIVRKMVVTLYKKASKKAKVVFFENEGNRNVFLDEKILLKSQTCLLNGAGVNIEEYAFSEYPTEQDKIHFLFIGRVMKEKGIDELIYASEKLREDMKRHNKSVKLDIVGPCEEQNYLERLEFLEKKGIVQYHGFQSDVKPFIEKCHCFVLPSYHEGMANTLLESAAMGRPLITSDIYGCREAVNIDNNSNNKFKGKNGFLVRVKDKEHLYEQMKEFVSLDVRIREDMAKESREYIVKKFSRKYVVEQTVSSVMSTIQ